MRHKWMVMLVVAITTLTTAQEAFRQYDDLKSQAATWATLRLWTGFLNAYTPQDEPFQAQQLTNCSASVPASAQAQRPVATVLDQGINIKSVKSRKQESSGPLARVEVPARDDNHRGDSFATAAKAPDSIKEVALLTETSGLEEIGEHVDVPAEPVAASDDSEADSAGHTFAEVRFVSRAANRTAAETAPPLLAGDADAGAASRRQTRLASRAQSLKARAMKRALKTLQIQLERTTRQELKIAEIRIELPHGINTTLRVVGSTNIIAADLPSSPRPVTLPALVPVTAAGGCAGE
jgi:hypothetical protein